MDIGKDSFKLPIGRGISRGNSRGRGRFLPEYISIPIGRGRGVRANDEVSGIDKSPILVVKLSSYIRTGSGSILEITMEYFENHTDCQYYIEKLIDASLQSSAIVKDFTMNFKLITFLKTHGEDIKIALFKKLQETFEKHISFMKDPETEDVDPKKKKMAENLCDLLNQLYYRFRLDLNTQMRYTVFERPVIECILYLVKARGINELLVLFKAVTHNWLALCYNHDNEMENIAIEIRSVLVTFGPSTDKMYLAWLLCIFECVKQRNFEFHDNVKKFYEDICGPQLLALAPCPSRRILADIPDKIMNEQMDKFECSLTDYTESIFLKYESS